MMRLVVLAALCAVVFAQFEPFPSPVGSGQTCNDVTICLQQGESDCNTAAFRNHVCAAGTFCKLNNVRNATTGQFVGTCTAYATLGQACSLETTTRLDCYDAKFGNAITCDDPSFNGSGICRYAEIFYPGEACVGNDNNFINGGCIFGSCDNGFCTKLTTTDRCTRQTGPNPLPDRLELCPFGTFCDDGNSDLCVARKGLNSQCDTADGMECDQLLTCTTRGGIYETQTCLEPFVGKVGDLCDNLFDCGAGLLCLDRICVEPAKYKKDFCVSQGDCQFGWECECATEVKGNKIIERGGKCTTSTAITGTEIKRWKEYQQCCKDNSCPADWWYVEEFVGNAVLLERTVDPQSCAYNCFKQAGYKIDDIAQGKCVGKVFSSAGAVLPALALIFAAVFALLF